MFERPEFPKSLDEDTFNQWLEKGRQSKMGYAYLLIVWDEYELAYTPIYVSDRDAISSYNSSHSRERFIAAYDLYSESRIL